jgi:hypothetical protein
MEKLNKIYRHVNLGFDPYQVDQDFINNWFTTQRGNYAQGLVDTWTPKTKGQTYGNKSALGSFPAMEAFTSKNTGFEDMFTGLDEYKRQGVYSNDYRGSQYNDFRQPSNPANIVAKNAISSLGDDFLNMSLEEQQKYIHDRAKYHYKKAQEGSFLGNLLISPFTPLAIGGALRS